ncbi:RING finger protein 151, partial [Myripristis murdjan]|uniref:RING finger protein 151 n=1 Tax=Myripristis murdjan TaxID=586833 RepID=UPI001175FA5B
QSGGYDVDVFVERPGSDMLCTICRLVLRCPVRTACSHVFCKSCILEWIKRQETCPCCRRLISVSHMVVLLRLNKAISHLKVKCQNTGCSATFPLSEQHLHSSCCPFQKFPCPQPGCGLQVPWDQLQSHARRCQQGEPLCPGGYGTALSPTCLSQHTCYRQLKQQLAVQRQRCRAVAITVRRKVGKLQSAMTLLKRQVALIYGSLEVPDSQEVERDGRGQGNESVGWINTVAKTTRL